MRDLAGWETKQAALIVYQHITDDLLKAETVEEVCAANRNGEIARAALLTVVDRLPLLENEKAEIVRTIEDANERYKSAWYRWLEGAVSRQAARELLEAK